MQPIPSGPPRRRRSGGDRWRPSSSRRRRRASPSSSSREGRSSFGPSSSGWRRAAASPCVPRPGLRRLDVVLRHGAPERRAVVAERPRLARLAPPGGLFSREPPRDGALPPGGKYVLGYHPHGVVSLGAFVGVGTNGVGLDDAFPGLDFHLCTLAVNFKMPFIRELILRLGIIPASKACIRRALARNGGAVCIAVGGAKEALLSTPGAPYELYRQAQGLRPQALLAEASLVPTFAFGELDVFRAPARGSRARRWLLTFQNWGLGWYGYSLPVFCGNLPFTNVGFGLQPISEAVHIVTGAPIPHDGVAGPVTDARVDAMHARYVAALRALFDAHKGAYAPGRELLIK
ncbi:2-acylglycerol O-acyltransferase [Aureococcus anophagefferens]|uniref:Acyltransferase n=1 Tax=Aureococcus anophagefferens TaxID=44056 RepID=A0ABR1G9V5_AURAN